MILLTGARFSSLLQFYQDFQFGLEFESINLKRSRLRALCHSVHRNRVIFTHSQVGRYHITCHCIEQWISYTSKCICIPAYQFLCECWLLIRLRFGPVQCICYFFFLCILLKLCESHPIPCIWTSND